MNIEEVVQLQGIGLQQWAAGYTFILLTDGSQFPGRIQNIPVGDPRMPLGSDPREAAFLYVLRSQTPTALQPDPATSQLRVEQTETDTGLSVGTWLITNRDDNPADPNEIVFELRSLSQLDS